MIIILYIRKVNQTLWGIILGLSILFFLNDSVSGQSELIQHLDATAAGSIFAKWAAKEQDPPTPNPASFEIPPAVIGGTTINMTAVKGSDASGIIEYYL